MAQKKAKPSKHGTLGEDDLDGAVGINVNEVLIHCQTPTTNDIFGATGKLPPAKAQRVEPRYTLYHTFRDEKNNTDYIALNKLNNDSGDVPPIPLAPGEYKIELKLNKASNKNFVHDISGTIFAGVTSFVEKDTEKGNEIRARGLPTSYMDVHFAVQAKKYALTDVKGVLDLGQFNQFTRLFQVPAEETDVHLKVDLFSHSVLKRLKVEGVLWRRDFSEPEEDAIAARSKANKGRELLRKALSSGEKTPAVKPRTRTRLDEDVDIKRVVQKFYETYAPDRIDNLPVVFKHFKNRDDDLIATLETKYKIKFDRRGNLVKETNGV